MAVAKKTAPAKRKPVGSRRPPVDNTTVHTVTISGKAFENGVEKRFGVKPTKIRKRGYGYQVQFDITRPDLRKLTDLMAELACDAADVNKMDVSEAIYNDLDRFPEAAGL